VTDGALVTVTETVRDRNGRVKWVVAGTFVGIDGSEPRCVDYRVRVVPTSAHGQEMHALAKVMSEMEAHAISIDDADALGEIPAEGIPRYVFEKASQARLLAKAQSQVAKHPDAHSDATRRALARATISRQGRARIGRPPSMTLGEKLRILKDVADAYSEGIPRARATVAERHFMSEGQLRDLLKWARHAANPPLFTNYGPGLKNDALTADAVALLDEGID